MSLHPKHIVHHVRNIRHAPHHVKRRWLWGLTLIAMAALLVVWLANLRIFLRIPPPDTGSNNDTSTNP
jgi:hypothetical protein